MKTFLAILWGFLLTFTISCTREKSAESTINFQIPKTLLEHQDPGQITTQSLSGHELHHVVVNIRDLATGEIVRTENRDAKDGSTELDKFSLIIQSGKDYLIQALTVYENSSTKDLVFYYGDTIKRPVNDVEFAFIHTSNIGASSGKELKIAGRYVEADGTGPTGVVAITFKPPGTKPTMVIMDSIIVAGWFNFFAVEGVNFDYVLVKDKKVLMSSDEAFDTASTEFGSENHRLRMSMPDFHKNNSGNWESEKGSDLLIGFYGPGPAATPSDYVLCYEYTSGSLNYAYQADLSTPISYDFTGDFQSNLLSPYPNGGDPGGGTCMASAVTHKYLFTPSYFSGGVSDLSGLVGPYQRKFNGSYYVVADTSNQTPSGSLTNISMTYEYLAGAYDVVKTTAFVADKDVLENYRATDGDYLRCHKLFLDSDSVGGITVNTTIVRHEPSSEDASGGTVDFSVLTTNLSNKDVAICPYVVEGAERLYLRAGTRNHGIN